MAEAITLARPYAKAAFEYAVSNQQVEKWAVMMSLLKLITENEATRSLLNHPELTSEQLISFYKDVCENNLAESQVIFLKLLAENKRLILLPAIADLYKEHVAVWQAKLNVDVITAMPIGEAQLKELTNKLEQKFKRKVVLECTEDKSLLAGVVLKVGDKVIDGSARGRLNRLFNNVRHAR